MEILDPGLWRGAFVDSLRTLAASVAALVPRLAGAIVVLAIGWLLSRLARGAVRRLLHRLGIDRAAVRLGVSETLARGGLSERLSDVLAELLFWVLLLGFALSAVNTLGVAAVESTVDRVIAYLPNLVAAGLILAIGLLLARLSGNLVGSGAAAAGVPQAARLGSAAHAALVVIAAVLALEQLGVKTALLVTLLAAVLIAGSVTAGLTFALGARHVITHILAGHYLRQSLPPGYTVELDRGAGVVEEVGSVATLIRSRDRVMRVPNGRLLDEIVLH